MVWTPLIIRVSEIVTKPVDLSAKLTASESATLKENSYVRGHFTSSVVCPSLIWWRILLLLAISYQWVIQRDIISRMYLESYTNITKSYFSFMMLLRFEHCSVSMATTPVQGFLFSHSAHCKSFMTCLPSVSSSLKILCPLLPDSSF